MNTQLLSRFLFLMTATICPQVMLFTLPSQAQEAKSQSVVNRSEKALFQSKVTITPAPDNRLETVKISQQATPSQSPSNVSPVQPLPLVPGRVQGVVPPFQRRPIPAPSGDIAVSTFNSRPDIIDLGSSERVPRISLREAPVRDVLTLIARVAGLNVAFADEAPTTGVPTPGVGNVSSKVSLDIENESAQDVFNSVLRLSNLDASRVGKTIFVAAKLPINLKNIVSRSYRLNQISVGDASAFLVGLGAERTINRQRAIPGVTTATVGTAGVVVQNTSTESIPTLESLEPRPNSVLPLRGLQVSAEERSNSLTLIGSPSLVDLAAAQLGRLDTRKKQVTVNVKIIEVTLGDNVGQSFGSSFNLGIPNVFGLSSTNGLLELNFGNGTGSQTFGGAITAALSSGNGKILTDPSLTVQEGETASVALTQDVVTGITNNVNATTGVVTSTTVTTSPAGLTLNINLARVDDNGFVNMSVSPAVSAIGGGYTISATPTTGAQTVSLLSKRTLNTGNVRLRDNQTLILSGIISDNDRESVSKVPFLGDLPIIGSLFRSTTTTKQRQEVIVIVTPRILDDTDKSQFGYTYQPGPEVQKILDDNGVSATPKK